MLKQKKKVLKKVTPIKERRKRVLSKHPSHADFRKDMPVIQGAKYVVRFGSTTEVPDVKSKGGSRIEINTIQSIRNSANKRLMKQCFNRAGVKTANWWLTSNGNTFTNGNSKEQVNIENLTYPIIAKHNYGSRGSGNYKLDTVQDLKKWITGKNLGNYIFEKYYAFTREYRLHVSKNGCFYTCRKALKEGTPEKDQWSRHDDNCVWFVEENPSFKKPVNWDVIVSDCVKALKEVGLSVGAFDVKVQGELDSKNKPRKNPEYILIEVNSAASHADRTKEEYIKEITRLIKEQV